jgi:type I restriction enzyme R subunit
VVKRVQKEIRKIGFWKNDTMREKLTKALVRDLDKSGLCPPKKEREIAQRLVALAKENHVYLSKL